MHDLRDPRADDRSPAIDRDRSPGVYVGIDRAVTRTFKKPQCERNTMVALSGEAVLLGAWLWVRSVRSVLSISFF